MGWPWACAFVLVGLSTVARAVPYAEVVDLEQIPGSAIPRSPREGQGGWYNGSLYIFGGFIDDDEGKLWKIMGKKSYRFTPDVGVDGELGLTGTLTRLADVPIGSDLTGNSHCGNAVAEGKIYLVGGLAIPFGETWDYGSTAEDYFLEYDVARDEWTALDPLPYKMGAGGLAYLEGELHAIGGTTDTNAYIEAHDGEKPFLFRQHGPIWDDLSNHYVYSLADKSWTAKAPTLTARNHISVAVFEGSIYVVGGQIFGNEACTSLQTVEVYDPEADTWSLFKYPLPVGRSHIAASLNPVGDFMFMTAGKIDRAFLCGAGGRDPGYGFVFVPNRGWTVVEGEVSDGASPVCGTEQRKTDTDYVTYCMHPNGVWRHVLRVTPGGDWIDKPPLTDDEVTGRATFEGNLATLYTARFTGGASTTRADVRDFCSQTDLYRGARKFLTLPLLFDAVRDYEPTDDHKENYAFAWYVTYWLGRCSADLAEAVNDPSLMAIRRDFEALSSQVADFSYNGLVDAINTGTPAESHSAACFFGKRNLLFAFVAGHFHAEIGMATGDFAEEADFICNSFSGWRSLKPECERAIGYAAVIRCTNEVHEEPTYAGRMPLPGAFAALRRRDIRSCAQAYADYADDDGKSERRFGVRLAMAQLYDYDRSAAPADRDETKWLNAFARNVHSADAFQNFCEDPPVAAASPWRFMLSHHADVEIGEATDGFVLRDLIATTQMPPGEPTDTLPYLNRVNIQYIPATPVGSIFFTMSFDRSLFYSRTESDAPYAFFGNQAHGYNYGKWTPGVPNRQPILLTATGYAGAGKTGDVVFEDAITVYRFGTAPP
mmetsp:Transcript_28139/g.90701  ORF Transcript_28139/g.90701 Transcript_28139/m.90701 type:complete len:826 (+) Transcript_28139:70-2547(+)